MKKIFKLSALLLVINLLFSPTTFAKSDNGNTLLVALGDSIPYGYNLSKNNENPSMFAFPYLIGNEANLQVRNLGVPGWKTIDLLRALRTDQTYRQAVKHADYITINIGNNDLLQALKAAQADSGGDPVLFTPLLQQKITGSNLFRNLGEIIKEARTLTDAPIAIYNVYNPFQKDTSLHRVALQVLPIINSTYEKLTTVFHYLYDDVLLADAYAAFGQNQATYVIPDDIHPTIKGQIKLAQIGLDVLGLN